MKLVIELSGESGRSFPVTLFNRLAYFARGTWMAPPGYLMIYSGYYHVYSGNVTLLDRDPGYLLGDLPDAERAVSFEKFSTKVGATGKAYIWERGPLGMRVFKSPDEQSFQSKIAETNAKWKIVEATGFEQKVDYPFGLGSVTVPTQ